MASVVSYQDVIRRATDADIDDEALYNIIDKVKEKGDQAATDLLDAAKERLEFPDYKVKERLLNVLDRLIIEGGTSFHQIFVSSGFLDALAGVQDPQLQTIIPKHLSDWLAEMGSAAEPAIKNAFPNVSLSASTSAPQKAEVAQRRPPGAIDRFYIIPINPLAPFLTLAYVRALRILDAARQASIFQTQTIHIARQALHLVVRLNDTVDPNEGASEEQDDDRIELEDQLLDLDDGVLEWTAPIEHGELEQYLPRVPKIQAQYNIFFSERSFFKAPRNSETDQIYRRLLAYDQRAITYRAFKAQSGTSSVSLFIDEENGVARKRAGSTGFIESVATSPAVSERDLPAAPAPLSSVQLVEANAEAGPSQPPAAEEVVASTSAGGQTSDDIERARKFLQQEIEPEPPSEQSSYTCPVPDCGRVFEKHYLLKHHIREHDDRPYRCPIRDCDKRFATPNEQRVHHALHRIKLMGIVPNMPEFSSPAVPVPQPPAPVSPPPAVASPAPTPEAAEEAAAAKPPDTPTAGGSGLPKDESYSDFQIPDEGKDEPPKGEDEAEKKSEDKEDDVRPSEPLATAEEDCPPEPPAATTEEEKPDEPPAPAPEDVANSGA